MFRSESQVFHGLRTAKLGDTTYALFSDSSGVYAQPLEASGAPRGSPTRLFDACDGGFDALAGSALTNRAPENSARGDRALNGRAPENSARGDAALNGRAPDNSPRGGGAVSGGARNDGARAGIALSGSANNIAPDKSALGEVALRGSAPDRGALERSAVNLGALRGVPVDSAVLAGNTLVIACSRRARDTDPGEVVVYTLDASLEALASEHAGDAGRTSTGIALSPIDARDGYALAWQDAAVSGSRIWYFEPGRMATPRQLSDDGWEASAPSLARTGSRLFASWAETRWNGERPSSRLSLLDVSARGAARRTILDAKDPDPSPRLVATPGGLIVSFRDRREAGRKTGLYLARVAEDGHLVGRVIRAGRADGTATPVLEPCLGGVVSATPRTIAGDYFVGVVRADAELRRLSAEQQFYQDSREFDRVAVHCDRNEALLLIAERGRLLKGNAALRSTTFRCD